MRPTIAMLVLLLAGCGTIEPRVPTAYEQQRLAQAIDGRIAGPAQHCLPDSRTAASEVVGGDILYRDGATLYRARTSGGCEAAHSFGRILVIQHYGASQICTGTIARVVDSANGMVVGSCTFEDFTPYRRP